MAARTWLEILNDARAEQDRLVRQAQEEKVKGFGPLKSNVQIAGEQSQKQNQEEN